MNTTKRIAENPNITDENKELLMRVRHRIVSLAVDAIVNDHGLLEEIGGLFYKDSILAENLIFDSVIEIGRAALKPVLEGLDPQESKIVIDGKSYHKVDPTSKIIQTLLGPVKIDRSRYRPSGKGEALVPADIILGLTTGNMTSAAAQLSMYLMSIMTARESQETWQRILGDGPSKASLVRLSSDVGKCMEKSSDAVLEQLREQETIPSDATSLLMGLDGVMMPMLEEMVGGKIRAAGWREASCGVVALLNAKGKILKIRYFGRLPESGKLSLKSQLSAEASHWLKIKPDLKIVAVADGARDNWEFLKKLTPNVEILDYWHAAQHLQSAADAAFGADSKKGSDWFEKYRHILLHDPAGVSKAIEAIRYLISKGKGVKDLKRELNYFRKNQRRMNYAEVASAGFPIGSGTVEAANKVLVTTRMKRSGQRWGRNGGQGVLTFRSLIISNRFDRAWEILKPQMRRGIKWKPPICDNDNKHPQRIALAA